MNGPATTWEKMGASLGLWTVLWLGLHYLVLSRTSVDPALAADAFAQAVVADRALLEWVTLLAVFGGLVFAWFMGCFAVHLRAAEGEPGRLTGVAFGVGLMWGAMWLASALFNSASILFATRYDDPAGARLAGILAREIPQILSPSILFALTLATAYVARRFGGFPKAYGLLTAGTSGLLFVLAIADWYGSGNLSGAILAIGLAWVGFTSGLLVARTR